MRPTGGGGESSRQVSRLGRPPTARRAPQNPHPGWAGPGAPPEGRKDMRIQRARVWSARLLIYADLFLAAAGPATVAPRLHFVHVTPPPPPPISTPPPPSLASHTHPHTQHTLLGSTRLAAAAAVHGLVVLLLTGSRPKGTLRLSLAAANSMCPEIAGD
ncbi:hypothetical protein ZWY2020_058009 [Hordeum vulgare]|nr:hypothetical protein ZWY2020_058009 [Hordeum vulgare]